MSTAAKRRYLAAGSLLAFSGEAAAHSFGRLYTLPIPVWMYLYGAAGALVVSFLVVALFVNAQSAELNFRTQEARHGALLRAVTGDVARISFRLFSVCMLWLCIATGLLGANDAYANFNMTFFWIVFVLGYTYLTALIGDTYAAIGPWRAMVEWLEQLAPAAFRGRCAYRERWAYWPALGLYMAFIWLELFAHVRPFSLALSLLAYTALNFAGAVLVGKDAWFRYCEFFSVFFRLIGRMGVLQWQDDAEGGQRLHWCPPFIGLLRERAESMSLLVFALFMLSSTAYDGVRETLVWTAVYWKHFYHAVGPAPGAEMVRTYPLFQALYQLWQTAAMILSPFVYLAVYLLFVWLAKQAAGSTLPLRRLALHFAFSLLPIALVYNITHYYTLVVEQGTQSLRLISDPFGTGWNLFGTAGWVAQPIVLDTVAVWHTQVWLILSGHIASVYLAHLKALKIFGSGRQATLSQLPMLLLMVALTTIGLWILSLPIAAGWVGPQ